MSCAPSPRRCSPPARASRSLTRFRQWWRLRSLERPLLVLLGGVTGVGKSTVATQLAGAARDHARDRDRPASPGRARILLARLHAGRPPLVLRRRARPADLRRRRRRARSPASCARPTTSRRASTRSSSGPSPRALRSCSRACTSCRRSPSPQLRERAIDGARAPRPSATSTRTARISTRGGCRPCARRTATWRRFDRIRMLQDYLIERAERAGIPIIDELGIGPRAMLAAGRWRSVLDAVGAGGEPTDAARSRR